MLRIFLPLYLILILFAVIFISAVNFLPTIYLHSALFDYEDQITKGTFYLIEEKLKGLNYQQQVQVVDGLQDEFGYPLHLLKPGDPLIDTKNWKIILSGESIQLDIDDANYNIKKIPDSDTVIAIAFSESNAENAHKQALGTFNLIKQKLFAQSREKWPDIIHKLQPYFGFPINLIENEMLSGELLSVLANDKELNQRFDKGKIIYIDGSDYEYYIQKLKEYPYILQAGPIKPPIAVIISFLVGLFILFFLGLAFTLFLWIRPLWISINELTCASNNFGQGKLESRASVKPRAALGNLSSQFNAMAERISRLITGHRDLTNAVSHELRTPIARMRFGLEMLERTGEITDEKAKQRYLDGLNVDVNDLEELVNELLHYARFEQVRSLPDLETIEVLPWLEGLIEHARGYAANLEIHCINNNVPVALKIRYSPHYLARVIHNLLRNACKYSQHEINIIIELTEKDILIHIDDDGVGILKQDRQRIFEPFSRLDESRSRLSGGHGLGLAIAKRIMDTHNGCIAIDDSSLGGARFTISLPK